MADALSREIQKAEHDGEQNVALKKTGNFGWDSNAVDWTKMAVDANGNLQVDIISGGGGGTQFTLGTDTYLEGTSVGTAVAAVRNDVLSSLADTDNEFAPLQVDMDGSLYVTNANKVDTGNSTTTPLGIDATFTGTGIETLGHSAITIQIFANKDGAANGMRFEFSPDNTNWDFSHQHDYIASTGRTFQFATHAKFFRVVFINGGVAQDTFRLQTILHHDNPITTIRRLDENEAIDRSSTIVKSVILAQAAGSGEFIPVNATAGGNFKVSVQEISDGLDIGADNAGAETQRVSISTDDVNLSAIKTATADIPNVLGTDGAAGPTKVLSIGGTQATGELQELLVSATGVLTIDGSAVTQPVSAASLPLPAGAATSAKQLADGHNVTIDNANGGSAVHIQDGGNTITVDGAVTVASGDVDVVGTVADDATTPGDPVMIGGEAVETDGTDPTSVTAEADVARVRTDRNRRLLVNDAHPNLWSVSENHTTAQTNNELKAAPGANLSLYITDIIVSNGATAGNVKFVEDTGGTPIDKVEVTYLAINGGMVVNFKTPIRITANKNFGFTSVTSTTHSITVNGYTAP